MALYPVAGSKIFIGGPMEDQSEDFTETDFLGETWIEIDGWTQMGGFGDSAEVINTPLINRGRNVKQKGTADAGSMENSFAFTPGDEGQEALIAAAAGNNKSNYAFKIEYPDAPAGGTPTTVNFIALVMSAAYAGGDANTIQTMNATLEINSNIVITDAAAGSG